MFDIPDLAVLSQSLIVLSNLRIVYKVAQFIVLSNRQKQKKHSIIYSHLTVLFKKQNLLIRIFSYNSMSRTTHKEKKLTQTLFQREYQRVFKILVIGDGGVGKTSLISRYVNNHFSETYVSTIGIDFKEKILPFNQRKIKLQIWDTAGQERFHTITKAYYRGAHGLIIAFDITDLTSFHHLQYWLQHISENCEDKAEKIIVGTKSDLYEKRKVEMSHVAALCEETGFRFIQASSKTGKNVEEVFETLGSLILKDHQESREDKKMRLSLLASSYEINFKNKKKCDC